MAALDNLWIIPNSSIFNKNNNKFYNTHWQDGMYYNYKNVYKCENEMMVSTPGTEDG